MYRLCKKNSDKATGNYFGFHFLKKKRFNKLDQKIMFIKGQRIMFRQCFNNTMCPQGLLGSMCILMKSYFSNTHVSDFIKVCEAFIVIALLTCMVAVLLWLIWMIGLFPTKNNLFKTIAMILLAITGQLTCTSISNLI